MQNLRLSKIAYLLLIALFIATIFTWHGCSHQWRRARFQKGVALGLFEVGQSLQSYQAELVEIRKLGANSVSLPVYRFQEDVYAAEIRPYKTDGFDQDLYDEQIRTTIAEAHRFDLSVLLMPIVQLERMDQGQWRGTLQPESWELWFESYKTFVLHYAFLAEEMDVEVFCVGSELASTEGYHQQWMELIQQVRTVYNGKLTYSANWDHYREVTFWNELDFLGLSGYYSLSDGVPPTYEELLERWQIIQAELLRWQEEYGKSLLFTEIGYPSRNGAARNPWNYTTQGYADMNLQRLCYKAFIETWKETSELAGTYLWIWERGKGGPKDRSYTWLGKPAQQEIQFWYKSR